MLSLQNDRILWENILYSFPELNKNSYQLKLYKPDFGHKNKLRLDLDLTAVRLET